MTQPSSPDFPPAAAFQPRGQRRWRVAGFLAGLGFTLLLVVGGYHWLTRPARVAALVAWLLQEHVGAQARIDLALFRLGGPIEIHGIRLQLPGETGDAARLLEIDRVVVQHRPRSLLWGRLTPIQVHIDQPRIYLTENLSEREFNWERLLRGRPLRTDAFTYKGDLPQVHIRAGQWIMGRVDDTGYHELGRFDYVGQMHAHAAEPGTYDFHLAQTLEDVAGTPRPAPLTFRGRFDLSKPTFMAELLHLDSTRVNPAWLPSHLAPWWSRLRPQGSLPTVRFGLNPGGGPWAKIVAKDVALILPLPQGSIAVTAHEAVAAFGGNTLHLEKLTGTLENCDFTLRGFVRNPGENATLKLDVDLQGPVPHRPQVLAILPPVTRSYLTRFGVRGRFHTQMTLQRECPEDAIVSLGTLDLQEGSLSDSRNPYPMEKVNARIRYDHDAVVIERIDAVGKSGAVIHAQGEIRPATNLGALDFVITMKGAPLDEYLLGALEVDEREIVEQLVSTPALAILRGKGVIGDHQPFSLDGAVDIKIEIHAPAGSTDTAGHVTTTIDLAGGKMLCDFWPYPLIAQSGQLVVKGSQIRVQDVQLKGLTGAWATLTGELRPDEKNPQRTLVDLRVDAQAVPLDAILLASLPEEEGRFLEQLGLRGTFDGQARIFTSPENDITFTIEPTLQDCVVQPPGSTFTLTDVRAKLTVQPDVAILESLQAKQGPGSLTLTGRMVKSKDQRQLRLSAVARDFPLEQGLLSLPVLHTVMDPKTLAQLRAYDPRGAVDATLELHSGSLPEGSGDSVAHARLSASQHASVDHPLSFALKLQPKQLNLQTQTRGDNIARVPMQDFSGSVEIEPGTLHFHNLRATVDGAQMGVRGSVHWTDRETAPATTAPSNFGMNLFLDAQAKQLTPGLRGLLPAGLRNTLDQMSLQGGFSLSDGRFEQTVDSQGSRLAWHSTLRLHQASAMLGVPVTEFDGTLAVSLRQPDADGPMLLDLQAQARRVRVMDRLVSPLSFQLLSKPPVADDAGPQADEKLAVNRLELRDLKGLCYGGQIAGSGTIIAGDPGGYSLHLVLEDAALDPIIHPRKYSASPAADNADTAEQILANQPTGRLSANLTLEGVGHEVHTRRGRGELLIREARLYEVPIAMAMLQLIHFTWPSSRAFDRATARYIIAGEVVHVEDLWFEAPDLRIIGEGTVRFPGLQLALNMYTRSPHRSGWGALGEAIDLIRDGILSIRVTGTLDQPQARVQSFSGIRRTWQDLFKPESPGREKP